MTQTIIAATECGISNNEVVPLIYFQSASSFEPFKNELFFKKGFQFFIASLPSVVLFLFKKLNDWSKQLPIDRKNITGFEKAGYQNFEAKKTSSTAYAIKRATAATHAGLIPVLAVQGISKWLTGNKSELHEGQIFLLNYEDEGVKKFIKVACEKSYEDDFTNFLTHHWTNKLG